MSDSPTQERPYKSLYGGGWLTGVQYLAEGMVARKARKEKTELPVRFWEQERWKREFVLQARHAASLIRLYSVAAVVAALRTPKGKMAYSLKAPFLDPIIRVEQERLDRQRPAPVTDSAPSSPTPPAGPVAPVARPTSAQSILSKLR